MHEKVTPWANGLTDEDAAYALLGLGLLPSRLYRQPKAALQALAATLTEDQGLAYRWHLDLLPSTPKGWNELPPAAEVAHVVRTFAGARPLRFALLPGSVLSTLDFLRFVGTKVQPDAVAAHVVGPSSQRRVRFRWPLRVGLLPGLDAEDLVSRLHARDSWNGNVYEPVILSRRNSECDVLMCIELASDAKTMIERATRELGAVRADVVAVFSGLPVANESVFARLEGIRAQADAGGIALFEQAAGDPVDQLRSVIIELSHNQTLDVAVAKAVSGRAILMASLPLLDASKLQSKATNLAAALGAGPQARIEIDKTKFGRWAEAAAPEPEPAMVGSEGGGTGTGSGFGRPGPRHSAPRRRSGGSGTGFGRAAPQRAIPPPGPRPPPRDDRDSAPSPPPPPPAPLPTRAHVARYLRRSARSLPWHAESGDASDLGTVMRALAEDDEKLAGARYLQAGFASERKPSEPLQSTLKASANYVVNVFIGQARKGFARGDAAFPDLEPRDDGRAHELEVVFWEPRLCPRPVVMKLDLPPIGPTGTCSFPLKTRKTTKAINARISILHRNRVLQTGTLKAPVGRKGPVEFELDAIPRRILSGLDERTNFSMAMVLNDTEGEGAVHIMADGKAQVLKMDDKEIGELVGVIGGAISAITSDPANYQGLRSPGSAELLTTLAKKGALLREYLERYTVAGGKLATPEYVQLVSTKPGKIFPLEFIYDYARPKLGAKLCDHAEKALAAGDCLRTCARHADPAAMSKTVCPFGFWGLRCVIERRLNDRKDSTAKQSRPGRAEPVSGGRTVLRPLSSVLVGATTKADAVEPTSVSGMLKRIRKIDPKATQVTDWGKWPDAIARAKPATLALVVHQDVDANSTPLIEIGPPPLLSSDDLDVEYVCAPGDADPPPIVLLIGCETGRAAISYENFALRFQWRGAALVVSTIAEVVGRQAAPMAADILEAIQRVKEPTSFAVVMRDVRRNLLATGTPMVLGLIADGDADWDIVGS